MNFLADESVEGEIVDTLRAHGHDVLYIAKMSPGIKDPEVLDPANRDSRVLITEDKDFGELVFRQQRLHQGVILIRLHGQFSSIKADTCLAAVDAFADEPSNSFAVLTSGIVQIRRRT